MSETKVIDAPCDVISEDEIRKFKEQINKTKCCRINAYKRCSVWDSFYKVIACVYNLMVIGLSILLLIDTHVLKTAHALISAILIIAAVCTFALDLYLRVVNYGSKAEQYKSAYNELESILVELGEVERMPNLDKFIQLRKRYATLMKNSINHEEQDYFKYVYYNIDEQGAELEEKDKNFYSIMKSEYRWYEVRDFLVKCCFSFIIYFFVWMLNLIGSLVVGFKDKRNRRKSGGSNSNK